MKLILLPTLGVNDEFAIVSWRTDELSHVAPGDVVAVAETTKTAFDLEAEEKGYLYRLVQEGAEVRPGESVALIHPRQDLAAADVRSIAGLELPRTATGARKWTRKAELLAAAHSINLKDVQSDGDIIREIDVLRHLGIEVPIGGSTKC